MAETKEKDLTHEWILQQLGHVRTDEVALHESPNWFFQQNLEPKLPEKPHDPKTCLKCRSSKETFVIHSNAPQTNED